MKMAAKLRTVRYDGKVNSGKVVIARGSLASGILGSGSDEPLSYLDCRVLHVCLLKVCGADFDIQEPILSLGRTPCTLSAIRPSLSVSNKSDPEISRILFSQSAKSE